jgi:hypothetical protein
MTEIFIRVYFSTIYTAIPARLAPAGLKLGEGIRIPVFTGMRGKDKI